MQRWGVTRRAHRVARAHEMATWEALALIQEAGARTTAEARDALPLSGNPVLTDQLRARAATWQARLCPGCS